METGPGCGSGSNMLRVRDMHSTARQHPAPESQRVLVCSAADAYAGLSCRQQPAHSTQPATCCAALHVCADCYVRVYCRPRVCVSPATTQREIKILADLGDGHLNIVHADEVILTRSHVGLVMEYVAGEADMRLGVRVNS